MSQPTLDEFRDEATAFLDANAKPKRGRAGRSCGARATTTSRCSRRSTASRGAAPARGGQGVAGQALRRRPRLDHRARRSYGGRELPGAYDRRLRASSRRSYEVPEPERSSASASAWWRRRSSPTPPTDGQGRATCAKMYRGDIVGCQLFSEPGAGSDLAGLQTKAERDGDEWIINGQKVWTSGAQYSDIGEIICRTDPDLPKHKGLTGFVVDMQAPGVEVRPLRQMTGGAVVQRGVLQRRPRARRPPARRRQRAAGRSRSPR